MTLATIGVYGFDADTFMRALEDADVRVLLDVRQRRGVRGSEYAWANAGRLQSALEAAGIGYVHLKELAPAYVERYTRDILDPVGVEPVINAFPPAGAAALFCVERDPAACHRSLIAARVADGHRVPVSHLRP